MAKKKKPTAKREGEEAELPKFGGFKSLEGLKAFKAKIEPEKTAPPKAPAPTAKPPPPPPERRLDAASRAEPTDEDDEHAFHRLMSGVTPLDRDGSTKARVPVTTEVRTAARLKPAELRKKAEVDADEVLGHLRQLVDEPTRFEVEDDGKRVEGRRADVPPSVLRTLRRGLLPIDARLDLHGLGAADARERVADFLRDKRARGERCVLVIHGKGNSSSGGVGVLRGEIAAWLSQGRAREHVAAFATASEEDGGEGAVYVALRR